MRFIYTLSILFYRFVIFFSAPFHSKARQWQKGRKDLFLQLKEKCKDRKQVACFHCASLGEYEQAKPLIQKFKNEDPDKIILVSFFSPSGYEIRKNDPLLDIVTYLPIDLPWQMREFLSIVNPDSFYFIKYEFWYNLINELSRKKIPFYFVSVIFRPSQPFFQSWGKWFAKQLKKADYFFVQNQQSQALLNTIGIQNVEITGDTRFDRVHEIATQPFQLDFVIDFKENAEMLVAGSTWEPDELILKGVMEKLGSGYKLIIAPHEIDEHHMEKLKRIFHGFRYIAFSEIEGKSLRDYDVLFLDTVGLLSKIYKYGDFAYVGGAFGAGLHNILEAAVYGIPVFFGPKYVKFSEAVDMVEIGGAFSIISSDEMTKQIIIFRENKDEYKRACGTCMHYVYQNLGAGDKIFHKVKSLHKK